MKKLLLILLPIVGGLLGYSQPKADNTFKQNESNIYYQAICQYAIFEQAKQDTIYLETNYIADSILSRSNQYNLTFVKVTTTQLPKILSKKKAFTLCRITELNHNNDGIFYIKIIPFAVTKSKTAGKYIYGGGGYYKLIFKFTNEQYVFQNIEVHGI